MNIRLISGLFKNHKISAPNSRRTHPMSERSRNAIFNKIQSFLPEADVLDAFAGTGALGFVAASRGAASGTMVESEGRVGAWLRATASRCGRPIPMSGLWPPAASTWQGRCWGPSIPA